MEVDNVLILKLEKLSKLAFSEAEREINCQKLNNILTMVEKLSEVNTQGVEPLVYVSDALNRWRKDEVANQVTNQDALHNAPASNGQYFQVPKMIQ